MTTDNRRIITEEIVAAVSSLTMVPFAGLVFAINQAMEIAKSDVRGDIVECGVWKGGCSIAMALAQRGMLNQRPVWMYDSFEGLPPAQHIDGPAARQYQADKNSPRYHDNCKADVREVEEACYRLLKPIEYRIFNGWFEKTLPDRLPEKIALLRIDCDWYESVKYVLDHAAPRVSDGGLIIIDDYYAWDGCSLAVHEWLAMNAFEYKIRTILNSCGAYIIKGGDR